MHLNFADRFAVPGRLAFIADRAHINQRQRVTLHCLYAETRVLVIMRLLCRDLGYRGQR